MLSVVNRNAEKPCLIERSYFGCLGSTQRDSFHRTAGPSHRSPAGRTSGLLRPIAAAGRSDPLHSGALRVFNKILTANTGRLTTGGIDMRHLVLAAIMAVGVGWFMGIGGASAAPANGQAISHSAENASSITNVAGACGRGWHRDRWGRCVP